MRICCGMFHSFTYFLSIHLMTWKQVPGRKTLFVAKRIGAIQHLNLQTGSEAYGLGIFTNLEE